jgi:hypothetical protein
MSFNSPTPLDNEMAQSEQHELEAKAARYSRLHPDEGAHEAPVGVIARAIYRIRAAFAGRR